MKLIEKNNRQFFRFALALLIIGSLLFYWSVSWLFRADLDEQLSHDKTRVVRQIEANQTLVQLPPIIEVTSSITPIVENTVFKDTVLFDPVDGEEEPFRQLVLDTIIQGKAYQIVVRNSLVESEDLLFVIGLSTIMLCIILFIGLYWMNRQQTLKLWQPFYTNLSAIRDFSLTQPTPVQFSESNISEFQELKQVLEQLTSQVQRDYRNLKSFTENASHEIQTPLAIIRSKIEELLADSDFDEKQVESIQEIYQSANRLSRLNRKLLLLTKIENRQFVDHGEVTFSQLVAKELALLSDLIEARQLKVQKKSAANLQVYMSEVLAEVMIKNLLENAIKHSQVKDVISIEFRTNEIVFANQGERALPEPEKLFERFYRRNGHSTGLGLAIVKNIATMHGFKVGYHFEKGMHQFTVNFNQN